MIHLDVIAVAMGIVLSTHTMSVVTQCDDEGTLRIIQVETDGAMVERAEVNAGLCVGCGACVAVCPHRAIDLNGWRIEQFEAMVNGLAADIPGYECSTELVSIG